MCANIEFLGRLCVQCCDEELVHSLLSGLGIPSDFSFIADGVPLGGMYSRQEQLLVMHLHLASAVDGRLISPLLDAPSENWDQTAEGLCHTCMDACQSHPMRLTIDVLRRRCRMIGGDGAMVAPSTVERRRVKSLITDKMWEKVHPHTSVKFVHWDGFHRVDIALKHVVKACAAMVEFFDISAAMEQSFGFGACRVVLRWAAAELEMPQRRISSPGAPELCTWLNCLRFLC